MPGDWIAILIGLAITVCLSTQSHRFLRWTVSVDRDFPPKYRYLLNLRSGGWYLGIFEGMLFFFTLLSNDYVIAGGWLTFKLGAKWASWQHVIKIPEERIESNIHEDLELRVKFGSMQLGRFLNGMMYHAFCGAVGFGLTKLVIARAWVELWLWPHL